MDSRPLIKDVLLIVFSAIFIALVYNYFQAKPLDLIPKPVQIVDNNLLDKPIISNQVQTSPPQAVTKAEPSQKIEGITKATAKLDTNKAKKTKTSNEVTSIDQLKKDLDEIPAVSYKQLKDRLNNPDFVIIDARSDEDYKKGHIGNSLNIHPYWEQAIYMEHVFKIPRDKKYILYCTGGHCDLSHHLAQDMMAAAFKNVFIYRGGWDEWVEKEGIAK